MYFQPESLENRPHHSSPTERIFFGLSFSHFRTMHLAIARWRTPLIGGKFECASHSISKTFFFIVTKYDNDDKLIFRWSGIFNYLVKTMLETMDNVLRSSSKKGELISSKISLRSDLPVTPRAGYFRRCFEMRHRYVLRGTEQSSIHHCRTFQLKKKKFFF